MVEFGLFVLAAAALLGSPGPGIAALVALGRSRGLVGTLPFYAAMQLGLAIAAGLSAAGTVTLLLAVPALATALEVAAILYLLWLAWQLASAPVGTLGRADDAGASLAGGFMLGAGNPKAYLAFVSLMGSFRLLPDARTDAWAKWALCVAVMLVVDLAWVLVGVLLGRVALGPRGERAMNVAMGAAVAGSALMALA